MTRAHSSPVREIVHILGFIGMAMVVGSGSAISQITRTEPPNVPALASLPTESRSAPDRPPADGNALVDLAAARVMGYPSISAQIRQRMDLYGRDMVGSGTYHQARLDRDLLFRAELRVPVAGGLMTLMQVCDGRFAWTHIASPAEAGAAPPPPRVTRKDVEDRAKAGATAQGSFSPAGIGGLLAELSRRCEFGDASLSQLGGEPVWLVSGKWRDAVLAPPEAPTGSGEGKAPAASAPAFKPQPMPTSVILALGKSDMFPYIVEYRQRISDKEEKGMGIVLRSDERIVLTIEFFNVALNGPAIPELFVYRPGPEQAATK